MHKLRTTGIPNDIESGYLLNTYITNLLFGKIIFASLTRSLKRFKALLLQLLLKTKELEEYYVNKGF
jgi:hypothetical protein